MLPSRMSLVLLLFAVASSLPAAEPKDNPVATFYSGAEGYPGWTDGIHWSQVINMQTYAKGKTAYEKFENARDFLTGEFGGGVLYYPAGTYDFTTIPPGRGLFLRRGVVIRGEAPTGRPLARDGTLELPTKFLFPFRERGGGKVPRDWNLIGLQTDKEPGRGKGLEDVDRVGIAWVHMVGAAIYFGPQLDWGKTWGTADTPWSEKVKKAWGKRVADGTHPFDPFVGGKKYQGAGKGRLIFGCVFEDAAVLDDFHDPGYGPDGFHTWTRGARVAVYGSRVFVANNLLPRGNRNFKYRQKTRPVLPKGSLVMFDYNKTCGIDINKEVLLEVRDEGKCPGYFEEGVVVRDNFVFNHGHKGFNISGNWVSITGNRNERAFLRQGDDVYKLSPWALTLDGFHVSGLSSDNRSRAFDLAGRNLWIDNNHFNNTGSSPGNDGEGILCQAAGGTQLSSWAITHNIHTRGTGAASSLGGMDVDCRGLLIGWNQTAGWVGNLVKRKDVKMSNCAFVANKCDRILPDAKTLTARGIRPPVTANPAGLPVGPTKVTAEVYEEDAVRVSWVDISDGEVGFRVERRIVGGSWEVIAYRPPRLEDDSENPQVWVDFTAPTGKELTYRVVAVNTDDNEKGASNATESVTLARPTGNR